MYAWRTCKVRHDPWDGTGAARQGARWNSPGHAVIYGADSFAGSILEILVHSARPRTLPGAHHAIRFDIPDAIIERVEAAAVPGWEIADSPTARAFGDEWIGKGRTAVLVVPALPSRPVGRTVIINTAHPDVARIARERTFPVPWDERLF